ncbi:MAG: MATE family efflux transporter [Porphyromonas somerae]|uniref:MATE family efflux transporter n=1 Tax=Porphyromonas somerae TaxID=322095 RepID=UPI0026EDD9C9|nr:MATE family efflux transporter [Porphyromonas somerae]MDD7558316.1 MATE family efflux transporter [Porphyromonas somerae]MDY5815444.1 MATE family efflux transporter [Porphyromonas somerae]
MGRSKGNTITTYDLGTLPIGQLLRYYAVPSIVGTMVNSLYNLVDRIFIGQGVGGLAISGLALTFPILIFLQAFGILVGVGASSRISILLGQKKRGEAEILLGNAFVLSVVLSLSTITLCYLLMEPMLYAFGASADTIPYAMDYLGIVIPGNIFANLTFSYNSVMRATGYPRKAMVTMIIGAVLNVAFDALFIFGLGWGIKGAAWATVLSMFVGMLFVMHHFTDTGAFLRIRAKDFKLQWGYVWGILSIGVAPFVMQLAASMVHLFKNSSLVAYGGDYAVGAHGISNSINTTIFLFILGLAIGMQPVVGYNFGAGNIHRVKEAFIKTVRLNVIIGVVGIVITQLFTEGLVRCFTTDDELIRVSKEAVRIENMAFWAVGFQVTSVHFFQSIGSAKQAMILSISRQVAFLIPLIYFLPLIWELKGVWLATPVADVLSFTISLTLIVLFFRKHKEEKKV